MPIKPVAAIVGHPKVVEFPGDEVPHPDAHARRRVLTNCARIRINANDYRGCAACSPDRARYSDLATTAGGESKQQEAPDK
jgi:hypothetical protein